MQQSPSWEANSSSASRHIPSPARKTRFITLITRAAEMSLFYARRQSEPSNLIWDPFDTILSSTPLSSQGLFPPGCTSLHTAYPTHLCDQHKSRPPLCTAVYSRLLASSLFGSKVFRRGLLAHISSLRRSVVPDQVTHPTTTGTVILLYILMFMFLTQIFALTGSGRQFCIWTTEYVGVH
jgi:hypothetical protein